MVNKVIGSGGFGITYLGRDTNLDKAVAIKEYFPFSLASRYDDDWVAPNTRAEQDQNEYEWGLSRFIDEARTLAKFEHPNLIRVIRYIEENGTAYIVMDFAEGRPLSTVVNEDGLRSEAELKAILLPLLDGLSLVHAADMLHRDVKPENIIIRADGTPILIDFGAARQAMGSRSQPISTILTPGYAPYEQYFSSGNQGPWTDIYALGAVAYACLTGRAPDEAVQRAVEDPTTPLVEAAKGAGSKQFLEAIDWAIRPREADRPQTVEVWKEALISKKPGIPDPSSPTQRSPGGEGVKPQPKPKTPVSSMQLAIVVCIIAVIGGGGYFAWDLSSSKGGFSNQQQATPAPIKVEPKPPPTIVRKPEPRTQPSPPVAPPQQTPIPPVVPVAPKVSPQEVAKDNANFKKAEFIGTPEAYTLYLRLHPAGVNAEKAKRRAR